MTEDRAFLLGLLNRCLAYPVLYDALQMAIGAYSARRRFWRCHVNPQPKARILDLGCGTARILDYFPPWDGEYIGVDMSEMYLRHARRKYGRRGRFIRSAIGDLHPELFPEGLFDTVVALGLLHHLDDKEGRSLFQIASSLLRPQGRICLLESVWAPGQSELARLALAHDRGRFVRDVEGYRRLAEPWFKPLETMIYHDWFYIPYSVVTLVGTRPPNERGSLAS